MVYKVFLNAIGHQSINRLCLTLLLCKCYKWMLNNASNQKKIFRLNCSLTTPRSQLLFKSLDELPLELHTCLKKSFLHTVHTLQGYSFWNSIDHWSMMAWRGGQREIRVSETSNYKHHQDHITSVRQMQSCMHIYTWLVTWSKVTFLWSEVTSIIERTDFWLEWTDWGWNDHGVKWPDTLWTLVDSSNSYFMHTDRWHIWNHWLPIFVLCKNTFVDTLKC